MRKNVQQFLRDESGQDLIEYTLLMAFIAVASATLFTNAGNSTKTVWKAASNVLANAAIAAS